MPVLIANPIYDVVFKYLLEDKPSAVLLLEALTGFQIEDLEFQPQEKTASSQKEREKEKKAEDQAISIEKRFSLTVFRLDFKALVIDDQGKSRIIIIELQKAMRGGDIMSFRNYLGQQYSDSNLFTVVEATEKQRSYKKGHEIFSIYILGSPLPQAVDVPVVMVRKLLEDRHTGELITANDDFINSLYHEGIIVSVSSLPTQKRDELERLLSIFDQTFAVPELQNHILELDSHDFPEQYKRIIERLYKASLSIEVREEMDKQDQALAEYEELENSLEKTKQSLENSLKREEESRKREEEERREKEKERREKEEALSREETMRTEILKNEHIDDRTAASLLGLSLEEVKRLKDQTK